MEIRKEKVGHILDFFRELKLVSAADSRSVLWLFEAACPFHAQLGSADSIHIHVKVDDTANLPHAAIRNAGGQPQNEQQGYIKYAFRDGLNAIFSSIAVAADDHLGGLPSPQKQFLDHAGVDMRRETSTVRRQFDAIPEIAGRMGWGHVPQGGAGRAVNCCYAQVNEKHWVFPPSNLAAFARPLEFAFGPLVVHPGSMGLDFRPIDPSHPRASEAACCATASEPGCCATAIHEVAPPVPAPAACCCEPKDLSRFAEVGSYASATMEKFWGYFSAAVSQPGALSVREKALIALAVAHSRQSAYCIDSFTTQCLEAGSNPEQMHEALHVAAAMAAGIDLVQGVQMQNALRAKGAIE
jgi:alkylhydroperoxidase/carboxymuconolactone decarboxylase family protein